jgi:hypothetical protein
MLLVPACLVLPSCRSPLFPIIACITCLLFRLFPSRPGDAYDGGKGNCGTVVCMDEWSGHAGAGVKVAWDKRPGLAVSAFVGATLGNFPPSSHHLSPYLLCLLTFKSCMFMHFPQSIPFLPPFMCSLCFFPCFLWQHPTPFCSACTDSSSVGFQAR